MKKILSLGILCLTLCFIASCEKAEIMPDTKSETPSRKNKSSNLDLAQQLASNQDFQNSYRELFDALSMLMKRFNEMSEQEKQNWQIARKALPQTAPIEQRLALFPVNSEVFLEHLSKNKASLDRVVNQYPELSTMSSNDFGQVVVDGYEILSQTDMQTERGIWGIISCIFGAIGDYIDRIKGSTDQGHIGRAKEFLQFEVENCIGG